MLLGTGLLPLCSRCTGIYASFLFVWVGLSIVPKTRRWVMASPLEALPAAAFLSAGLVLSLAEAKGYFTPGTVTRMFAGAAAGMGLALMLLPVYNQIVVKRLKGRRAYAAGPLVSCVAVAVLGLFSLWDARPGYYVLALASVGGLILLYLATNVNAASLILGWSKSRTTVRGTVNLAMLTAVLILAEALIISSLRALG